MGLIKSAFKNARSFPGFLIRAGRHRHLAIFVALPVLVLAVAIGSLLAQRLGETNRKPESERDSPEIIKKRAEWFFHQRAYPLGHIPFGARLKALRQRDAMMREEGTFVRPLAAGRAFTITPNTSSWTPIGPQPTTGTFFGNTSGRVNALAVDPCDSTGNTVYLGAADGGVWKTTDGGTTWTHLTDAQPSLSTGSLAVDPLSVDCMSGHTGAIYYGTGEENFAFDSIYGAGVLKSTDGGSTWTQDLTFSAAGPQSPFFGGPFIGGLSVDPANGQIVLASVLGFTTTIPPGVWRSANGGATWTKVFNPANFEPSTSVAFDPSDTSGNTAYAALAFVADDAVAQGAGFCPSPPCSGIFFSTDGGQTWKATKLNSESVQPSFGRITLALASGPKGSPSSTVVYAAIANGADLAVPSAGLLGLFKGTNIGASNETWTQLTNTPAFCNEQCFYDISLAVDPANENVIFAGGGPRADGVSPLDTSTVIRSTDGGSSWSNVTIDATSGFPLHVDTHAFAFGSNGGTLYTGDDGGVWSSSDVTNPGTASTNVHWTNLNSTLQITQFYPGLSIHPTNSQTGFAGAQDNGTQMFSGNVQWVDTQACGDGAWTAIDVTSGSPFTVYTTCEDIGMTGTVNKSTQGGIPGSFFAIDNNSGIVLTDRADFVPPLVIDSRTPQNLYFGTFRIYQTTNGGSSWATNNQDLTGGSDFITTIDVAPTNSSEVVAGTGNGFVWETMNALSGTSATFTRIDNSVLPMRSVTQVAVDPNNMANLFVTFSGFSSCARCDGLGHIFKTSNSGASWTNITGDLPDIPVNDIVIDPTDPTDNHLYIATDIGVFATSNGGGHWMTLATGLPNAEVLSLKLQNQSRTLRGGTHGRGVWDLALPSAVSNGFIFGSPSPSSNTVPAGQTSPPYTIPVTAVGTFSGPVMLSCSSLPQGSMCQFSPNPVTPAANSTTNVTLTISTTARSAVPISPMNQPASPAIPLIWLLSALAIGWGGLALAMKLKRMRRVVYGVTFAAATLLLILSGCGGGGGGGGGSSGIPGATLNPTSLNFGSQVVGFKTASQTATLTNSGTATLNVASISVTGTNSNDFTQSNTCPALLPASVSCTFQITFTPSIAGAESAALNVSDNASGRPQMVALSGMGDANGTPSGTFTITINGTASTNSSSTTVSLTVQ